MISVFIKSNNPEIKYYELKAFDASKGRIGDTEVLEMKDINGNLLYNVPLEHVLLFKVNDKPFDVILPNERKIKICLTDNKNDIFVECDSVSLTRFINDYILSCVYKSETINIPINNIKYIDYTIEINNSTTNNKKNKEKTFLSKLKK